MYIYIYSIVEGVGPLPVQFLVRNSSKQKYLRLSSVQPAIPLVVVELAVMIWMNTFIDFHYCLKIVNLPRDVPDPV